MTAVSREQLFREEIARIVESHRPSRHTFFARLGKATAPINSQPILELLYVHYQAAMHATRVMGYFLPHLDSISLRVKKLSVLADDDGIPGGDTHHYQLRKTWTTLMGKVPDMDDEAFGELDELKLHLVARVADFVTLVQDIYPKSLGPWVVVEGLAHDWIGALLNGLKPHFPDIDIEDTIYFTQNYSNCLEIQHAQESLDLTAYVLSRRPELYNQTVQGAWQMARGLDELWLGLEGFIR